MAADPQIAGDERTAVLRALRATLVERLRTRIPIAVADEVVDETMAIVAQQINQVLAVLASSAAGSPFDWLLQERSLLLDEKFQRRLPADQMARLAEIDSQLEIHERRHADAFDRDYPESRMAKLDRALDRLEGSLQTMSGDTPVRS